MDWKECREREVKKVGPNKERARSLRSMAERRLEFIQRSRSGEGAEFIVENYYETIKELATSLMFVRGYKSYSHVCLIVFLREFYRELEDDELKLIDQLRRTRNDIMYRGESVALEYLERREREITRVIKKLFELVDEELKR